MAKAILICGRICCGKSTYAQKLCREYGAALLSSDELMLAMFDPYLGDRHEECVAKVEKYLYSKAVRFAQADINVVLDWGFWEKESREKAKKIFSGSGIECELHYLDITESEWKNRIEKRNLEVEKGTADAYYVDRNLTEKCLSRFEMPDELEIDVLVKV